MIAVQEVGLPRKFFKGTASHLKTSVVKGARGFLVREGTDKREEGEK